MAIKQRILRIWDGAASAVKLCCIKFAQRVVLAQTTALAMDKVRYFSNTLPNFLQLSLTRCSATVWRFPWACSLLTTPFSTPDNWRQKLLAFWTGCWEFFKTTAGMTSTLSAISLPTAH